MKNTAKESVWKFNFNKLGLLLLGIGPMLIQFSGNQIAWWIGLIFSIIGPFLACLHREYKPEKKKK